MVKVSIIMPVYNCEKYLEECIRSVQSQSLLEWELVCVDDGSTDASVRILEEAAGRDSRILVFRQENQGAGAARNRGLKAARGKYAAFLDADDFYLDGDVLERMYRACQEGQVPVCASSRICMREDKEHSHELSLFPGDVCGRILDYRDFQTDYFFQTYLLRRSLLEENGLFFPGYRRYQDPPFLAKALYAAGQFVVLDHCGYSYRMSPADTRFSPEKTADLLRGMRENLVFARQYGLEILFHNTAERLEYDFASLIYENMMGGGLEILELLLELNHILYSGKGQGCMVKPLRMLLFSREHCEKGLLEMICSRKETALYGGGKVARALLWWLRQRGILEKISKIIVSGMAGNEAQIEGIPVMEAEAFFQKESCFVLVAAGKRAGDEIAERLKQEGYFDFAVLDNVFGDLLRKEFEGE